MRKLETSLYTMDTHDGEVRQVAWSPHDAPILASAASDRKIMLWDLRRIGEEQTAEDAEDGPPELVVRKLLPLSLFLRLTFFFCSSSCNSLCIMDIPIKSPILLGTQ
jgi:WD40 repeat protein